VDEISEIMKEAGKNITSRKLDVLQGRVFREGREG